MINFDVLLEIVRWCDWDSFCNLCQAFPDVMYIVNQFPHTVFSAFIQNSGSSAPLCLASPTTTVREHWFDMLVTSFRTKLEKDSSVKYKSVANTFRQFELFNETDKLTTLVRQRNYISTIYTYRLKSNDTHADTDLLQQIANNRYLFYKVPALAISYGSHFDATDVINAVICEDKRTLKIMLLTIRIKDIISTNFDGKPFLFELTERAVGHRKYSVRATFFLNWCEQFVKLGAQSTWYDISNELIWSVSRYLEYLRCSYRITRRAKTSRIASSHLE